MLVLLNISHTVHNIDDIPHKALLLLPVITAQNIDDLGSR